jgi:hypothetical protein
MQLPFIEAANTLQEELRALRRENQQLRGQLEEGGLSAVGSGNRR